MRNRSLLPAYLRFVPFFPPAAARSARAPVQDLAPAPVRDPLPSAGRSAAWRLGHPSPCKITEPRASQFPPMALLHSRLRSSLTNPNLLPFLITPPPPLN